MGLVSGLVVAAAVGYVSLKLDTRCRHCRYPWPLRSRLRAVALWLLPFGTYSCRHCGATWMQFFSLQWTLSDSTDWPWARWLDFYRPLMAGETERHDGT